MQKLMIPLTLLSLALSQTACEVDTNKHVESVQKGVNQTLEGAQKSIETLLPKAKKLEQDAGAEVAKLFTFEYNVKALDGDLSPSELEGELSKLGALRWECFHVEKRKDTLLVFASADQRRTYDIYSRCCETKSLKVVERDHTATILDTCYAALRSYFHRLRESYSNHPRNDP